MQSENGVAAPAEARGGEAADSRAQNVRYGAYICLDIPPDARSRMARVNIASLIEEFALSNEFDTSAGHPVRAVAFLKRVAATPGQIDDPALLGAEFVVHIAAGDSSSVEGFCHALTRMLKLPTEPHVLRGVVRPTAYTSNTLHDFAYARQAVQESARVMPNAFLIPMSKSPEWWEKHWMERHTYFLPQYDASGRMVHEGHALAAAPGIPGIMRRTYKSELQPAPEGTYEFLNYFECADTDVSTFESVVAALRDVRRNPEWAFVREGPMWSGRRVRGWRDLFEARTWSR